MCEGAGVVMGMKVLVGVRVSLLTRETPTLIPTPPQLQQLIKTSLSLRINKSKTSRFLPSGKKTQKLHANSIWPLPDENYRLGLHGILIVPTGNSGNLRCRISTVGSNRIAMLLKHFCDVIWLSEFYAKQNHEVEPRFYRVRQNLIVFSIRF